MITSPTGLHIPPWVARDMEREKELDRQEDMAVMANRILRQKDPRLSLVFVKEGAHSFPHPGRWHIERKNDGDAPSTYIPITGPNGEYVQPSIDRIMERLNERDLWREGGLERMYAKEREEERETKKALQAAKEEAQDEARITAKVIMGQQSRKRKTAPAAANARDNLPTSL